jgi:hypothetical protein
MKHKRQLVLAVGSTLAALGTSALVACGGGAAGGGSASASAASSSGAITAFGSVFVNTKEFTTSASTSVVDGDGDNASASAADLQVGMSADVTATGTSASTIVFTSAVRGEIDSIDPVGSTITVLGQPVLVTSATSFAGSVTNTVNGVSTATDLTTATDPMSALAAGDYVVVHGFVECSGATATTPCSTQVVANLVMAPASTGSYKASGYITNYAANAITTATPTATGIPSFTLNGLNVTVPATTACATTAGTTPSTSACSGLANGQYVNARSTTAPTGSGATLSLAAGTVKVAAQSPALTVGSSITLEGSVSQIQISTTSSTFDLRGVTIDATSFATAVASLKAHEHVQVTGTVNANGTVTATAMQVEQHANLSINAPLDSANLTTTTLSVLGKVFTVSNTTRFEDHTATTPGQAFNVNNFSTVLAANNQVLVSGYISVTTGQLMATRVTRLAATPATTVVVQGEVTADSSTADTITIGGVYTATLGTATVLKTPGNSAAGAGLTSFFAALTPATSSTAGSVVTIKGASTTTAGAIDATATTASAKLFPSTNGWAKSH